MSAGMTHSSSYGADHGGDHRPFTDRCGALWTWLASAGATLYATLRLLRPEHQISNLLLLLDRQCL